MRQEIRVKKCLFAPAFTTSAVLCPSSTAVTGKAKKSGWMFPLPRQRSKQETNQSVCMRMAVQNLRENI